MHVAGGGSSLLLREIVELAPLAGPQAGEAAAPHPGQGHPDWPGPCGSHHPGKQARTGGRTHTCTGTPWSVWAKGEEGLVHCPCFPAGLHMGLGLALWPGSLTATSSAGLSMVLSARHRQGYFL